MPKRYDICLLRRENDLKDICMKVARLTISNFRSIKQAELYFDGHTLLVGPNNVGKSTICEALDLALGPDRLNRFPPVEEYDFYNAEYLKPAPAGVEGAEPQPIPFRIEVVLIELTDEVRNACAAYLEFWHTAEKRVLDIGEIAQANPPNSISCLRLETVGKYSIEEDEFEANTFFSHSPNAEEGELTPVRKHIKRLLGFLYLRALRTGSRALSLERGSLLDVILRIKGVETGFWEKTITRLRGLQIENDAPELITVLQQIEQRLGKYIPSTAENGVTKLHVSQLTREHLRKTISFFLAMSKDQNHVPFHLVGTGTLNILVLALLTFIADLKPGTVIFAMEEPEIAVPPHTQRRIADYLLQKTTQSFVSSHSPFVIERFEPKQTYKLSRADDGTVSVIRVSEASGLKDNDYKRFARQGLTECMLGKGAILVEGVTEFHALPVAARKMEEADPGLQPLDIAGVAFFDAESDGQMPKFGLFLKNLNLKTFSFYDFKQRQPAEKQRFTDAFTIDCEHPYEGFEELIAAEVPTDKLWEFLSVLRSGGENGHLVIPAAQPPDDQIRTITQQALSGKKGAGWAARLFESCQLQELPPTVVTFLTQVYGHFPKPAEPHVDPEVPGQAAPAPPPPPPPPPQQPPPQRSRQQSRPTPPPPSEPEEVNLDDI